MCSCVWDSKRMNYYDMSDTIVWRLREIGDVNPAGVILIFELQHHHPPPPERHSGERIMEFVYNEFKKIGMVKNDK
jgi:hypothetical protein